MSPRRPSRDLVKEGQDLANTCRNERQKTILLCEAGRLSRDQVDKIIRDSKGLVKSSQMLIDETKKLCERADAHSGVKKKKAGS